MSEQTLLREPKGVQFKKGQTEYQLFPEEYFTGTDCYVYFNDLWIDELTALNFGLSESVMPIFGYASYTWDHVSRGSRIVTGEFAMAFKEAGYLYGVLKHFRENQSPNALASAMAGMPKAGGRGADILERIEDALGRHATAKPQATNNALSSGKDSYVNASEKVFSEYEQSIWGRTFDEEAEQTRKQQPFFASKKTASDKIDFNQQGFDIYINYGPLPQYVQAKMDKIPEAETFNTTVKAIRNVQIKSVRQIMDANTGEPIYEVYEYIAKDLD